MGFGAIITSEDQNTPLSDDLLKWLVEARVEQSCRHQRVLRSASRTIPAREACKS